MIIIDLIILFFVEMFIPKEIKDARGGEDFIYLGDDSAIRDIWE